MRVPSGENATAATEVVVSGEGGAGLAGGGVPGPGGLVVEPRWRWRVPSGENATVSTEVVVSGEGGAGLAGGGVPGPGGLVP